MNKDGNIKGKFNIIDLLVIILIIAVIAGIVVRFGSKITTAVKSDEEFEYTVKLESVRQYTVDALEKKGKLSDKKATVDLGEIIDVQTEPAAFLSETADGRMVYAKQPDRYTVYVTIRTRGKESDNSYITADSEELSVGRDTEIYSKYVHTTGVITSVKKLGD
ncbi:MAG: DUF4330 domain-containing protein [Candidatus Ornithomonoglobus sp.]